MKFSINQSELQSALTIVLKGVSTRSTLPILSGILLEAQKDKLTLQTTDLELSIQYSVAALVEEEGKAVVPGKLFSEIVKNLSDAAVHVEADEVSALITCDASSFSIKALNAEDFPGFPHVDVTQRITIPFTQFASMVRRVGRAVSKDASRAILTGVLVTWEEEKLKMVGTDAYRLAITEAELLQAEAEEFEAVISGSFLSEIASLSFSEADLSLALSENQIVVTCGDTVFINRRLEGKYPNYKQLLFDNYNTRAKIDTGRLLDAVKRTSLLGSSEMPVRFDLNVASQTVQLSAAAQDIGTAQETIGCEIEGEDAEIAFNHSFVISGLQAISTDTLYLDIQEGNKPGIFRADTPENYLFLVMPVRTS